VAAARCSAVVVCRVRRCTALQQHPRNRDLALFDCDVQWCRQACCGRVHVLSLRHQPLRDIAVTVAHRYVQLSQTVGLERRAC